MNNLENYISEMAVKVVNTLNIIDALQIKEKVRKQHPEISEQQVEEISFSTAVKYMYDKIKREKSLAIPFDKKPQTIKRHAEDFRQYFKIADEASAVAVMLKNPKLFNRSIKESIHTTTVMLSRELGINKIDLDFIDRFACVYGKDPDGLKRSIDMLKLIGATNAEISVQPIVTKTNSVDIKTKWMLAAGFGIQDSFLQMEKYKTIQSPGGAGQGIFICSVDRTYAWLKAIEYYNERLKEAGFEKLSIKQSSIFLPFERFAGPFQKSSKLTGIPFPSEESIVLQQYPLNLDEIQARYNAARADCENLPPFELSEKERAEIIGKKATVKGQNRWKKSLDNIMETFDVDEQKAFAIFKNQPTLGYMSPGARQENQAEIADFFETTVESICLQQKAAIKHSTSSPQTLISRATEAAEILGVPLKGEGSLVNRMKNCIYVLSRYPSRFGDILSDLKDLNYSGEEILNDIESVPQMGYGIKEKYIIAQILERERQLNNYKKTGSATIVDYFFGTPGRNDFGILSLSLAYSRMRLALDSEMHGSVKPMLSQKAFALEYKKAMAKKGVEVCELSSADCEKIYPFDDNAHDFLLAEYASIREQNAVQGIELPDISFDKPQRENAISSSQKTMNSRVHGGE